MALLQQQQLGYQERCTGSNVWGVRRPKKLAVVTLQLHFTYMSSVHALCACCVK
jgi:hypothetical protein